jgi:hypothetical protein
MAGFFKAGNNLTRNLSNNMAELQNGFIFEEIKGIIQTLK